MVRMPGPWDGPVRVVDRSPTWFRFATLRGHLEAEARSSSAPGARTARCGSRSSPGREAATGCPPCCTTACGWSRRCSCTCGRTSASGSAGSPVAASGVGSRSTPTGWRNCPVSETQGLGDATRRALDELHDKGLNFDLEQRGDFTPANGWNVDDYCQPLPSEPAGRPLSDGSWQAAGSSATTPSPTRRSSGPSTIPTARWHGGTCSWKADSWACASTSAVVSAASTTSCEPSTHARSRCRVGTAGPCRATWRWGRWTTRSGSGSTAGRSSSASTSSQAGVHPQSGDPARVQGVRPGYAATVRPARLPARSATHHRRAQPRPTTRHGAAGGACGPAS